MPVYAYRCKNCGHAFDVRQSFSDDALSTCPACHQEALRKVYNTVGVQFKGSGFYSTDSGSGAAGPAPAAAPDASSGSGSSGTTTGSTD